MRRIALVNQKGGVGKTTTAVNLGAALALQGRRVLLMDLDPQANLSMHLGLELGSGEPSTYTVLCGDTPLEDAIRETSTPGLSVVASNIDLSGAELELANAIGRELLLRDALDTWVERTRTAGGGPPVDYVLFDCPPSLGLLSVNGLAASREVFISVQTQFFALQGMSKLVEVVHLLRRRINPELEITGIIPSLYDSRLRLAREVLGEIREYFPGQVFQGAVTSNVKLAEAPSYGQTIFQYAPESRGAKDYADLALEVMARESGSHVPASSAVAHSGVDSARESVRESPPPAGDERASERDELRPVPPPDPGGSTSGGSAATHALPAAAPRTVGDPREVEFEPGQ